MTLDLEFFPNEWIPELEKAMDKVKNALVFEIIPQGNDDKFSHLVIGIDSYTDLYLVGFWAGFNSAESAFNEAMPQVVENMTNYINKITNPSTN